MDMQLLTNTPIDVVFLVFSLFFPRIAIIGFFLFEALPTTTLNTLVSVLLTVFLPRVFIIIMIAQHMGTSNIWFYLHIIVAIVVYLGGGRYGKRRFYKDNRN